MAPSHVTVYGFSYVGRAVVAFLENQFSVQVFDPAVDEPRVVTRWEDLQETPFAVICVPTPSSANGSCDTPKVERVIRQTSHDF